jgi:hypothetical protein
MEVVGQRVDENAGKMNEAAVKTWRTRFAVKNRESGKAL